MCIGQKVGSDTAVEVHAVGTAKEIKLSRALASAIDQMESHAEFPKNVREAFVELYNHYQWQIERDLP